MEEHRKREGKNVKLSFILWMLFGQNSVCVCGFKKRADRQMDKQKRKGYKKTCFSEGKEHLIREDT